MSEDDFLGQARINTASVVKHGSVDSWINLDEVESGQIHLKLYWLPTSKRETDYRLSESYKHSRALLMVYLDSASFRPIMSNVPQVINNIQYMLMVVKI